MRTLLAEACPPGFSDEPRIFKPRLGLVGAGANGRHCLEAIAKSGAAQIVAIADPVAELAAQVARTCPQSAVLASLDDLLEVEVDGVVIATPSALHAEQ